VVRPVLIIAGKARMESTFGITIFSQEEVAQIQMSHLALVLVIKALVVSGKIMNGF
jgi:hypothetical protein